MIAGYRNADPANLDAGITRDDLLGHIEASEAPIEVEASVAPFDPMIANRFQIHLRNALEAQARRVRAQAGGPLGKACWFCLKEPVEVKKMVEAETGARICDECVGQCIRIMGL